MDHYSLLSLAIEIATKAHEGQTDKGGKPYILHPIRVANRCETIEQKIVAILHDTIEDTYVIPDDLKSQGFDDEIIEAILSVTRQEGESYNHFIERCNSNKIGRQVKIADLKDNLDLSRLESISEKDLPRLQKYLRALKRLTGRE